MQLPNHQPVRDKYLLRMHCGFVSLGIPQNSTMGWKNIHPYFYTFTCHSGKSEYWRSLWKIKTYDATSLWVSRVLKYPKSFWRIWRHFSSLLDEGIFKNMEEIEFSRWLFESRPRQGKNVLPDGLNWLCYFAGSSKSHRENSISSIFLESSHQVDMKNVVKCYKHFFCYFNALKTHCESNQSRMEG